MNYEGFVLYFSCVRCLTFLPVGNKCQVYYAEIDESMRVSDGGGIDNECIQVVELPITRAKVRMVIVLAFVAFWNTVWETKLRFCHLTSFTRPTMGGFTANISRLVKCADSLCVTFPEESNTMHIFNVRFEFITPPLNLKDSAYFELTHFSLCVKCAWASGKLADFRPSCWIYAF